MTTEFNPDTEYLVLTVPHMGEPKCHAWTADELKAHVFEKAFVTDGCTTLKMLADAGYADFEDAKAHGDGHIADLADKHKADTPLWAVHDDNRAYVEYQTTEPDWLAVADAIMSNDVSGYFRVEATAEAVKELLGRLRGPNAPSVGKCGPLAAADALEKMAVEGEVIPWAIASAERLAALKAAIDLLFDAAQEHTDLFKQAGIDDYTAYELGQAFSCVANELDGQDC